MTQDPENEPGAEALKQGQQMALEGRFVEAATLYEEGGRALLAELRVPEAMTVLVAASQLHGMAGQLAEGESLLQDIESLAQSSDQMANWTRGWAELTDLRGETPARVAAWSAARDATDDDREKVDALATLASIASQAGKADEAAAYLSTAMTLTERIGDPELLAECLLELAVVRTAAGSHQSAKALLDRVDEVVPDDHVRRARASGQRGIIAITQSKPEEALRHAQAARAGAVVTQNVPTYLASSQLIVMIHESAGRLVEAYDTLVRARESLRDLAGENGAGLVEPAINLFADRLGAEKFEALQAEWAATRKEED